MTAWRSKLPTMAWLLHFSDHHDLSQKHLYQANQARYSYDDRMACTCLSGLLESCPDSRHSSYALWYHHVALSGEDQFSYAPLPHLPMSTCMCSKRRSSSCPRFPKRSLRIATLSLGLGRSLKNPSGIFVDLQLSMTSIRTGSNC